MERHRALKDAIHAVKQDPLLTPEDSRAIVLAERTFMLSGIDLPLAERERFAEISSQLSELAIAFGNAVMDATQAWTLALSEGQLQGLPAFAVDMLAAAAVEQGAEGWLATLSPPLAHAILTFAEDRDLRATVYHASTTRASDQGPHAGIFDNGERIAEILRLRREKAALLGFPNAVAHSLATKMATDREEVGNFLQDLFNKSRPIGLNSRTSGKGSNLG
jgi:oligopeptidase A